MMTMMCFLDGGHAVSLTQIAEDIYSYKAVAQMKLTASSVSSGCKTSGPRIPGKTSSGSTGLVLSGVCLHRVMQNQVKRLAFIHKKLWEYTNLLCGPSFSTQNEEKVGKKFCQLSFLFCV